MLHRIVSLIPAATEILCALGLEDQLVGVTHACDFPPSVRRLPTVTLSLIPVGAGSGRIDSLVRKRLRTRGALYALDRSALEELRPDLIVTQALCDVCAVPEEEVRSAACSLPGQPRVINLEPQRLSDVFASIRVVGRAAGVESTAEALVGGLQERVAAVADRSARLTVRPRVALMEWLDPPFSCGHWSPELVRIGGGAEGLGREGRPARTLSWAEVVAWAPEVVFIACCGFDVERAALDVPEAWRVPGWKHMPAVRKGQVYAVDGSQYFSRPGPRLVDSLEILAHTLHPAVHPLPPGLPKAVRLHQPLQSPMRSLP